MTVQTNTTVANGIGNGVTSVFPVTYKFNRAEDLIVYLVDMETEAETPLTLYSDSTIERERWQPDPAGRPAAGRPEGGSAAHRRPATAG